MIVILDAEKMTEREVTHTYLKEVLELPEYYGNNLDALHDCLAEMKDVKIVFVNEEKAGEYYGRIKRIIQKMDMGI